MPFCLVFGFILLIIAFAIKKFSLKEVNLERPQCTWEQQRNDIKTNKKSFKIMLIVSIILIITGAIGTFLI